MTAKPNAEPSPTVPRISAAVSLKMILPWVMPVSRSALATVRLPVMAPMVPHAIVQEAVDLLGDSLAVTSSPHARMTGVMNRLGRARLRPLARLHRVQRATETLLERDERTPTHSP